MLPEETQINLSDISYALAHINRFGGHSDPPVTVGAHSIVVMMIVERYLAGAFWIDGLTKDRILLTALLHDAQEAYLGDVPNPLKAALPDYVALEAKWVERMGEVYPLVSLEDWPIIKTADRAALILESDLFKRPGLSHYHDYPSLNTIEVRALVEESRPLSIFYANDADRVEREFSFYARALVARVRQAMAQGGNLDLLV
jgi:5'-deoxynucleotidase YfbR-like HD superfamily hydrolase